MGTDMCLKKRILSVYFDGELPEQFKRKAEEHLAVCEKCRKTVSDFGFLSRELSGNDDSVCDGLESVKARLWNTLSAGDGGKRARRYMPLKGQQWRRTVTVPLPFVIASCFIMASAAGFLFYEFAARQSEKAGNILARYIDEEQDAFYQESLYLNDGTLAPSWYPSDMDDVVLYLNNNISDVLDIRLPESKSFNRFGEPKLINESNYQGRRTH
ncbi:MAG: zf-HC2 domain-containing protein [Spirochaetaceae bacterium]|jgi:hypothetical protein|nr:zf-HC2 domain-containing protein [Spirochaetaceae bacterium]